MFIASKLSGFSEQSGKVVKLSVADQSDTTEVSSEQTPLTCHS